MSGKRRRPPRELFVSHSSKDQRFAMKLVNILRDYGYGVRVWFSPRHIIGAQEWHDEIGRALNRCDWFLIVLTPNAVRSEWVRRELLFALNSNRYKGRIIPLLRRKCEYSRLSWTLEQRQFVDFRQDEFTGFRSLFRIWGMAYKRV